MVAAYSFLDWFKLCVVGSHISHICSLVIFLHLFKINHLSELVLKHVYALHMTSQLFG